MKGQKVKWFTALLTLMLVAALATGCSWMGRTAGKAQAKAEKNLKAIEQGYHDGYEQEHSRSKPKPESVPQPDSNDPK